MQQAEAAITAVLERPNLRCQLGGRIHGHPRIMVRMHQQQGGEPTSSSQAGQGAASVVVSLHARKTPASGDQVIKLPDRCGPVGGLVTHGVPPPSARTDRRGSAG
jgi:hypothetical protein